MLTKPKIIGIREENNPGRNGDIFGVWDEATGISSETAERDVKTTKSLDRLSSGFGK
jgi:hypothetical protein